MSARPWSGALRLVLLLSLAASFALPGVAEAQKKRKQKGKSALEALQERIVQLEGMKEQMELLQVEMEDLRAQLDAQAGGIEVVKTKQPFLSMLRPFAHVTVRFDNIWTSDLTDIYAVPYEGLDDAITGGAGQGAYVGGFRAKVRFGLRLQSDESFLVGGIRVAVGQNPNPSSSFVPLGQIWRPTGIGLDMYWLDVRPFKKARNRLSIRAGKMPNPLWRGKVKGSGFASEMIFDNDVNPAGVAVDATIVDTGGFKLRNVAAWYVVQDNEAFRFRGLTGETSLILDQIMVETKYFTAAVGYLGFENLNAGLRAPGIVSTHGDGGNATTEPASGGAFVEPGTTAFLLRPGLQGTNNRVNYGPGADGFIGGSRAAFRLLSVGAQGHFEFSPPEGLDRFMLHVMVDYVVNLTAGAPSPSGGFELSTPAERHGISGTVGTTFGGGKLKGVDVWGTFRYVQADATLSAIADSDLGRGTEYWGGEVAAAFTLAKNFKLGVAFFHFQRFPNFEVQDTRLFVDAIANF